MEMGVTYVSKKFQSNRPTELNSNGVHQFKSSEVSSLVVPYEAVIQIKSSGIPLKLALLDRSSSFYRSLAIHRLFEISFRVVGATSVVGLLVSSHPRCYLVVRLQERDLVPRLHQDRSIVLGVVPPRDTVAQAEKMAYLTTSLSRRQIRLKGDAVAPVCATFTLKRCLDGKRVEDTVREEGQGKH